MGSLMGDEIQANGLMEDRVLPTLNPTSFLKKNSKKCCGKDLNPHLQLGRPCVLPTLPGIHAIN